MKQEIEELEESLNGMHDLKVKACSLNDEVEKTIKAILIDSAIHRIDSD
jgi:aminoglycoside phosphotransferase